MTTKEKMESDCKKILYSFSGKQICQEYNDPRHLWLFPRKILIEMLKQAWQNGETYAKIQMIIKNMEGK